MITSALRVKCYMVRYVYTKVHITYTSPKHQLYDDQVT